MRKPSCRSERRLLINRNVWFGMGIPLAFKVERRLQVAEHATPMFIASYAKHPRA
jgi:hypothetical protein